MRVLTAEEMRRAEKLAVEAGSSYEALMEQAGQGAASLLLSRERARLEKEGLTVLLGRGNNGGDGLVIARAVLEALPEAGVRLIFCLGEALSELAALNLARLERFGGRVERYTGGRCAGDRLFRRHPRRHLRHRLPRRPPGRYPAGAAGGEPVGGCPDSP